MIAETYVYDKQNPTGLVRLVLDNDLNSRADVEKYFKTHTYSKKELQSLAQDSGLYAPNIFRKEMIIHRIIQHIIEIIFGEKHF